MDSFTSGLYILVSTTISLGITMPFFGSLVRYRANYTPKLLELPGEEAIRAEKPSHSFFKILGRVRHVEGWTGFYKGFYPALITNLLVPVVQWPLTPLAAFAATLSKLEIYQELVVPLVFYLVLPFLVTLLLVPMQIITFRAIITTHRLRAFAPKAALGALLSPAERAQPLRLYLAPGVVASNLLAMLVIFFAGVPAQAIANGVIDPRGREGTVHRVPLAVWISVGLIVFALIVVLLTPLRLFTVRLAVQQGESVHDADLDADAAVAYAGSDGEGVIERRSQQVPYTSVENCLRQIVREEGKGVLFRGWWAVVLQIVFPLLFPLRSTILW